MATACQFGFNSITASRIMRHIESCNSDILGLKKVYLILPRSWVLVPTGRCVNIENDLGRIAFDDVVVKSETGNGLLSNSRFLNRGIFRRAQFAEFRKQHWLDVGNVAMYPTVRWPTLC